MGWKVGEKERDMRGCVMGERVYRGRYGGREEEKKRYCVLMC